MKKAALFCYILGVLCLTIGAAGRAANKPAPTPLPADFRYAPGEDLCLSVSDFYLGGCEGLAEQSYDSVYIFATQKGDEYIQDSLVFKMSDGRRKKLVFKGCGSECNRGLPVDEERFELFINGAKQK